MIRRHLLRRPLGVLLAVVLGAALLPIAATPAGAASASIDFVGYGYGHGRGMSQWGSQGYASTYGWSAGQILDRYYGGTVSGQASAATDPPIDPDDVHIRLQRMAGRPTKVTIGSGTLTINGNDTGSRAIEIRPGSNGRLEYRKSSTCGGLSGSFTATNSTTIKVGKTGYADPYTWQGLLAVCPVPSSDSLTNNVAVWYPGEIHSKLVGASIETVNVTKIEHQLRSVVPRESPASWDHQALRAQSVAARSYALSGDSRWSTYADTCDTTFCQVYVGWFWRKPGTSTKAPTTDPRTDDAISSTAGIVRLNASNRIARTEFSSSSGGYTAGGTFPAVKDDGDLAASPYLGWEVTKSAAPLESAYGGGSRLTSIRVVDRNGLGALGGRVLKVELKFANGTTRIVTGNDVRSRLGLRSDWFEITNDCGAAGQYIDATYELFLSRSAAPADVARWCDTVNAGNRLTLTSALSVSDEWAGVEIDNLYRKILGRPADSNGRAYWLGRVANGHRIEDIAAYFFGGTEYFTQSGRTNTGFVKALYLDLLGRKADSGLGYWTDLLNRGVLDRAGVATNFYASIESRKSRVNRLYLEVLGRKPDANGRDYWAGQLRTLGDVVLAANLAASQEFYIQSTR